MIKAITSKDNPRVKFACSLKENKFRKEHGLFLAETYKALEMALLHHQVVEVFTTKWIDIDESIPQNLVSEDVLKKISSNVNPEGVVFIAKMREYNDEKYQKILYLDQVSDPGNMGTLIRTALAFSYDAVFASEDSCSIYNEKVVNSTKGAIFALPVFSKNIDKFIDNHEVIVSTLDSDSEDLEKIKVPQKFILVMGNESHGVRKEVKALATKKVKINISNIDSLNVAVAGGILMNRIH